MTFAGLTVDIRTRFHEVREACSAYISARPADFAVFVEDGELAEMKSRHPAMNEAYCEFLYIYRKIAERMPYYGRFMLHGAAVSYDGGGYLFIAPSGTGKTTHITLWRRYIGEEVDIINGDKPVVSVAGGTAEICGTPWAGKENLHRNASAPLKGVCLVRQGEEDKIIRAAPIDHLQGVLRQVYRPDDGEAWLKTADLVDIMFKAVPFYVMDCTPTENAVRVSFPAMTGKAYPKGDGK